MRNLFRLFFLLLLTSCISLPQYPGGQRIALVGVSFVPPAGKQWSMIINSTYQTALGARGHNPNETFVIATQIIQISTFSDKDKFLKFIQEERAAEPQTGRFEVIRDSEVLDGERMETCVKHKAASKDFGAKRGGPYTIYETYGMNCIHPNNPNIDVFIELSRKVPPEAQSDEVDKIGEELLRSVKFSEFR